MSTQLLLINNNQLLIFFVIIKMNIKFWVNKICQYSKCVHHTGYNNSHFQVDAGSSEECHDSCQSFEGCGWFSYDAFPSLCFLFKDCPTLDESCESCVSSSALCKAKTSKNQMIYLKPFVRSKKISLKKIELRGLQQMDLFCNYNLFVIENIHHWTFKSATTKFSPIATGKVWIIS